MKKIYLYVAFALASIGMISCTDILDQDPLDSFTDEAVWNLSLIHISEPTRRS